MATNTEVNVRINVDAKGADKSVGSIKKQLKEATNELIAMREKFGDSSTEAVNAAKKVAELKDAIGDAKAMTDAFDPDAKFKAFGAALQGVAGGFSAVQGAQALFGSESEAVAQTLAKVQGAMALSQGINSVLQARDSFKNLGAVLQNNVLVQKALNFALTGTLKTQKEVTTSKKADTAATEVQTTATTGLTTAQNIAKGAAIALRGAILATGIGAIVIGIIALIQKIMEWTGVSDEAEKKQQAIAVEANKREKELSDRRLKRFQIEQELAIKDSELAGASSKQITELRLYQKQKEIAIIEDRNKELRKLYNSSNLDLQNAAVEELEANKDLQQEAADEIVRIKQDARQKDLDNLKAYNQQLLGLQQSNYLNAIKDDDKRAKEKARIDFENNIAKLKDTEYSEAQKTELTKQYAIQRDQEIAKINDALYKKQKDKRDQESKETLTANENLNKQILALQNELLLASIQNEDERAKKKLEIQFKAGIKEIEQSKANENLKLDAILALQAKYDSDIKAIDDAAAKRNEEKAAEKRQKEIEFENETDQILQENRINNIKNANDKVFEEESLRFQNEIDTLVERLNNKEITEEQFRKRREAIQKIHEDNVTKIQEESDAQRLEKRRQKINEEIDSISGAANALGGILQQSYSNQLAQLEENSKERIKAAGNNKQAITQIEEETALQRNKIQNEEVKRQKIFAIAEALINTYKAGAQVFARPAVGDPVTSLSIKISTMIAAIAAGVKNVMSIRKVPLPSGSGGTGGAGGSETISANAPLAPQLNTTMMNQSQINQLSSATNRAYVVESDVTGNQERIQRLNRAARIN